MNSSTFQPRGMFFEEFKVGKRIISAGRTITESDIVNFAGLSGDFNQIHVDADFARNNIFGKRVAHGILVMSIASGLAILTGMLEGTVLAFREIINWKFSKPVFIGDTIHVEMEITKTKAIPKLGGGSVLIRLLVKNQDDIVVNRGNWSVLIASKGN